MTTQVIPIGATASFGTTNSFAIIRNSRLIGESNLIPNQGSPPPPPQFAVSISDNSFAADISHSELTGGIQVGNSGQGLILAHSEITETPVAPAGKAICVFVHDAQFQPVGPDCQPIL